MSGTDALFVYVTIGDRDAALYLGRALVEAKLAAAANIIDGVHSIYRWQGVVEEAAETVLVLKTRRAHLDALTQKITDSHDYDCPCVVALPIVGGNPDYLRWITAETTV
jgi:periplasmic divalent cation tolerance protein